VIVAAAAPSILTNNHDGVSIVAVAVQHATRTQTASGCYEAGTAATASSTAAQLCRLLPSLLWLLRHGTAAASSTSNPVETEQRDFPMQNVRPSSRSSPSSSAPCSIPKDRWTWRRLRRLGTHKPVNHAAAVASNIQRHSPCLPPSDSCSALALPSTAGADDVTIDSKAWATR
jgi:hypothetical protein